MSTNVTSQVGATPQVLRGTAVAGEDIQHVVLADPAGIVPTNVTGGISANGAAVALDVSSMGVVAIQVVGTWVGTLQVEGRGHPSATLVPLKVRDIAGNEVTSLMANGLYLLNAAGLERVRILSTAWTSGAATIYLRAEQGVPLQMAASGTQNVRDISDATFMAATAFSAFAASKFHYVMLNTSATAVVKIMRLVIQPGRATVTGVLSGPWALRRRNTPTTAPAGAGTLTPSPMDTTDTLPAGITVWNTPGTSPAGGTTNEFGDILPQADEVKLSTLDAPTQQSLLEGGGVVAFDARLGGSGTKPITLRQNQVLELQQDATGGTGNAKVFCVFTVA